MTKPVWTVDQIVANLDRKDVAWLDGTVTYSFLNAVPAADQGDEAYTGFMAFNGAQRAATQLVLDLYADVIDLDFVLGADGATSNNRITFANSSTLPDYAWGWTQGESGGHSAGGLDSIDAAEIWVNTDTGVPNFVPGGFDFMALMHEVGHALGLSHPGDYDADGGSVTYQTDAEYEQDSLQYTVMSYFAATNTGGQHYSRYASTPLLHDVAALQAIYGANMETRTGDTTYGFHSNAGRDAFDFNLTPQPIIAIWDAGGIDTIDLSGFTETCRLDLNAGAFSDMNGLLRNLTICYGVTIENAIGGSQNDTIIGNDTANRIEGGAGLDVIYGGAGNDTFIALPSGQGDQMWGGAGWDAVVEVSNGTDLFGLHEVEEIHVADSVSLFTPSNAIYVNGHVDFVISGRASGYGVDARGLSPASAMITLQGTAGDDIFHGANSGINILIAGGGDDELYGHSTSTTFRFAMTALTAGDTVEGGGTVEFLTSGTLTASQVAHVDVTTFRFAAGNDTFVTPSSLTGMTLLGNGGIDTLDISAALAGGATLDGGIGNDILTGSAFGETMLGGVGDDAIHFERGGADTVDGGIGNDTLFGGLSSTYGENLNGGLGTDTLVLNGDFDGVLVSAENIEVLRLEAGHDYSFATNTKWQVDGSALGTGDVLTLDGTAVNSGYDALGGRADDSISGGSFLDTLYGGGGNDALSGNASLDKLYGGDGDDTLDAGTGALDRLYGGNNNDTLKMGADYDADDILDGGKGSDTLVLDGNYVGLSVTATMIKAIETVTFAGGYSYDVALADGTVAKHEKLIVDASLLAEGDALAFSGAAETNSRFAMTGGAGGDTLTGAMLRDVLSGGAGNDALMGGLGSDTLTGGDGADSFAYATDMDSHGKNFDKVVGFDGAADTFDLWFAVTGMDTAVTVRRPASILHVLDADHLGADHACIATTRAGDVFLAIDANGIAGFQLDGDLVIGLLAPANLELLTAASFI